MAIFLTDIDVTLSKKLFLVFLASLAVAVTTFVLVIRLSVVEGFRHYVSANDRQELHTLAVELGHYYQTHHSWDALRHGAPITALSPLASPRERPEGAPGFFRRGRFRPALNAAGNDARNRLPMILLRLVPRIALVDADGSKVWGPPPGLNWYIEPITVDGREVGRLSLRPRESLSNELERRFVQKQQRALLILGGLILVFSAFAAWWLSRHLMAPVKNLLKGTQALRRGEYGQRLTVTGKDELGQLVLDFNDLAQTLEKTEALRRQWVADMSHELRTPLAVLQAELESIQDGIYPLDMERIGLLHQDVLQINKLVHDLHELALSDLGALSYRKEPVDLVHLLETVCTGFEARCHRQGLILTTNWHGLTTAPFEGDPARLAQLFHNLLENSVRYTDKDGEIRVSLHRLPRQWQVVIEDSPPGVPEWALPRLFERLFRVDRSRSRRQGGSGLGLSICQNIVEAHNGDIRAGNSPLGGLKLTIRWPI